MKLRQRQELAQRRAGRDAGLNDAHVVYGLTTTKQEKVVKLLGITEAIGIAIPLDVLKDTPYLIIADMTTVDINMVQADSI